MWTSCLTIKNSEGEGMRDHISKLDEKCSLIFLPRTAWTRCFGISVELSLSVCLTAFSSAVELTPFEIFAVKRENRRPSSPFCHNSHTSPHAFPQEEKCNSPRSIKKFSVPGGEAPFCFRFGSCLQRRFLAKAKGRKTKHVPHGKRIYYAGVFLGKK